MNEVDKVHLLEMARNAISAKITGNEIDVSDVTHLNERKGVFVKLMKHRHLRGGAGVLESEKPLYRAVIDVVQKAAFEDPRFSAIQEKELLSITIEITIINNLEKIRGEYPEKIEVGKHGLLLEGNSRALIMPQNAKKNMYTPVQFLNALSQKAGLSFNGWQDKNNSICKFETITFTE